jgi:hypothetical protein
MPDRLVTIFWEQGGVQNKGTVKVPDGHDVKGYITRFIEAANNVRPPNTKPVKLIRIQPDA